MESTTYRNEKNKLLVKELAPEELVKIARELWRDDRLPQLVKELNEPLDEYVRVFVGITGQTVVKHDQFVAFLDGVLALRRQVELDQDLIKSYKELEPVDRAIAIPAVEEVARLILMSVTSGTVSGIAGTLVRQFLSREKRERVEVLVGLLLSSPIPALLSKYKSGLTVKEIAEETKIAEAEVGYFLAKYEERGWVSKEHQAEREVWVIRSSNIAQGFKS